MNAFNAALHQSLIEARRTGFLWGISFGIIFGLVVGVVTMGTIYVQ